VSVVSSAFAFHARQEPAVGGRGLLLCARSSSLSRWTQAAPLSTSARATRRAIRSRSIRRRSRPRVRASAGDACARGPVRQRRRPAPTSRARCRSPTDGNARPTGCRFQWCGSVRAHAGEGTLPVTRATWMLRLRERRHRSPAHHRISRASGRARRNRRRHVEVAGDGSDSLISTNVQPSQEHAAGTGCRDGFGYDRLGRRVQGNRS
jgi:hypothetical protein